MGVYIYTLLTLLAATADAKMLSAGTTADGQYAAVLSVSPAAPKLADTITLTIDVHKKPSMPETPCIFPEFGDSLGELKIVDIKTSAAQLVIKALPQHTGKTPIWEIPVNIGDTVLVIPKTEINIAADIDTAAASLDNIIIDAEPINTGSHLWLYFLIAAAVAAAILLWFIPARKARRCPADVPLTLQEQALLKIAALIESRLHESDVKQFAAELSAVIRWYIERRTDLNAAELTTEELLQNTSLPSPDAARFLLTFADFVKFAKHQPAEEEIMQAIRKAEEFITNDRFYTSPNHVSVSGLSA